MPPAGGEAGIFIAFSSESPSLGTESLLKFLQTKIVIKAEKSHAAGMEQSAWWRGGPAEPAFSAPSLPFKKSEQGWIFLPLARRGKVTDKGLRQQWSAFGWPPLPPVSAMVSI